MLLRLNWWQNCIPIITRCRKKWSLILFVLTSRNCFQVSVDETSHKLSCSVYRYQKRLAEPKAHSRVPTSSSLLIAARLHFCKKKNATLIAGDWWCREASLSVEMTRWVKREEHSVWGGLGCTTFRGKDKTPCVLKTNTQNTHIYQ